MGDGVPNARSFLAVLCELSLSCTEGSKLRSFVEHRGYSAENMTLDMISVFGAGTKVSSVTLNGREVKFFYSEKIQVRNEDQPLSKCGP